MAGAGVFTTIPLGRPITRPTWQSSPSDLRGLPWVSTGWSNLGLHSQAASPVVCSNSPLPGKRLQGSQQLPGGPSLRLHSPSRSPLSLV
eukprot:scaffold781_cov394-Prasinococcus_capsulatus_cf.AAC.18